MSEIAKQIADLLKERAAKVTPKYMRWMRNHEQDEDGDYCPECAEKLAAEKGLEVDGWNDYFESDSPRWCDTCSVLLYHSLTRYGVEELLETCAELGVGDCDESAWILHNLVDGIGDLLEEDEPLLRKILDKLQAERKEELKA